MSETIGHYRIEKKLGEGGMGIVYAARDERLDRPVAIKMIREAEADPQSHERFWREARAAAAVNHPNVCQLYEIGEDDGRLFIAMELLEGESLASRIRREPLPLAEAVQLTLSVLGALQALHHRGLVHRDLKPSNVFLTPHGVKLLDFGLARPIQQPAERTTADLTLPGMVVGTPEYMSPEQLLGEPVDARSDLFAVGALVYAMLAGKSPFAHDSVVKVLHGVVYEHAPALGGSPVIVAVDRVIHRALAKRPADRYQGADAMAQDLRAALVLGDSSSVPRARPMTRLIVLPLRILRSDAETDFLAFSLPDAVTGSLSGLESLIVRSSLAAARFAGEAPDLKAIAAGADVDVVLAGTLLRAGPELRVTTQLLEAPEGTVLWTQTSQVALGDLFQLQDELARRIVESLQLPLTTRDERLLGHDVPASAKAYEFYLRANQLGLEPGTWQLARDLYKQCLDADPRYAPAWARLGRMQRIIGKYVEGADETLAAAEQAFRHALELNPDLSIAHRLYAQLEIDLGRAQEAMIRLLRLASVRSADPELFAGLVPACRYCGLLEASVAAHERARRLDPKARTSVPHTYLMMGEYEKATADDQDATDPVVGLALSLLGRTAEAVTRLRAEEARFAVPGLRAYSTLVRSLLEGRLEETREAIDALMALGMKDPEAFYYAGRSLAYLGDRERAVTMLTQSVEHGFVCVAAFARDPWLDSVRADPGFMRLVKQAETRHRAAREAFLAAGGDRILGLSLQ